MAEFFKQMREHGEKVDLTGNTPLILCDPQSVWFVESGSLNLFAIERKEGKAEGKRTLIATVTAPTPLFAFPVQETSSHEVVAITESPTVIWKAPLEQVEKSLAQDPTYINEWINHLAQFHKKELVGEGVIYLESGETKRVEQGESLSLKRALSHDEKNKIGWVEVEEGEADFLGYASLPLPKGPFPLTYHAWVSSEAGAVVKAIPIVEDWKEGLQRYQALLLDYFFEHKLNEEREERARSHRRKEDEAASIHTSLKEMASVLNPFQGEKMLFERAPLLNACQLIGRQMNLSFHPPKDLPEQISAPQLLTKIADASEVRYRQIRMRGQWWKRDCGHILGFYGDELKPVALLMKRPGVYRMIDPERGTEQKIDADLAREISTVGYYFYPSFPNELKTGKQMLRFYLKQNRKEFLPLVLYSVLSAIISLFPPFATEKLINNVIPDSNHALLWQIAAALIIAALSSGLFLFFRSLMVARLEGRTSNQLLSSLWDRLLKLPLGFFRRYTTGNLIMRVMSAEWMRSVISGNSILVLFTGLFSLFYLLAMAVYAPALTVIVVITLIVSFTLTLIFAGIYARMQKKYYEYEGSINAFLIQTISSVGKLRIAGAEKNAFARFAKQFAEFKRVDLRSQNVLNIVTSMNYVLPFLLYLLIFGYVISTETDYSVGTFLAFNTAFVTFYIAMTSLSNAILSLTPVIPLWHRSKVIVEEPLEEQLKAKDPGKLTGEIHVDEVCFKYEGDETNTLNYVSLKVNPKELVGIVGPSGCGKSTLIRLLLGFERPHSGAVYYDDKDLSSFTIHEFRKQLGVVLQEEGIIAGSIFENLTCGGNYTKEQVERALQISGFAEDIDSFPMGLHTYLTIGGTTLSGGQKQRLLIARALLPNPKILLLDEATSALDNRNQEKVIKSIDQMDVTRIVIAHRLSTIRNADRIYVMQKGQFIQTGTFNELAAQPGLFGEMLKRQSL